jgi:hypothetical protein
MNFGQAFTYVFEDPDWAKKVLIPALIGLIPLIGQFFLIGWSLDVTRRVMQQNPRPLPDLDFGRQLVDGLKAAVIGLVYALPILVLEIPIMIASAAVSGNGNMDSNTAGTLVTIVSLCCGGLIMIYALLMAFALPAAYGNFIANERLGAAFRFNEIFALLRAAPGAYLLTFLGLIVSGFIAGLGSIACFIGVFVTLAYSQAVNGHLYGQAYNEAIRNRAIGAGGGAQVY